MYIEQTTNNENQVRQLRSISMTKEQTRDAIKVMQAWCDGKQIERRSFRLTPWMTLLAEPAWNFIQSEYRIKPEPPEPIEIEAWVHNETGRALDTSVQVTPVGYTKRKFREVVE
jgi:hypothetical protein